MSDIEAPSTRCKRSADLLAHKALVRQIAHRIRARLPASVGLNEMEQAGMIGLNEALSRFEEGRGSSFETYAARRIEGAMLDELRATDTLSRDTRALLRAVRLAVQRLEHRLGRAPRAKEVANELGWSIDKFHRCMVDAGAGALRSDGEELENRADDSALWASDDDEDMLIDEHADPLRTLQQRQRHIALNAAFDALEEAERFVVESIYKHGTSLRDIGEVLGVSESRVSRMSAEIVAKLKLRLRDW
ncbi:MAG: sigma-70 family RNA polymerase sigma factor [Burkholderiales bacterium]|jgi:RNA polymerase sigma factor FliA|nr:sigma-70 family RNA polymerase sigma factor [Burkholderiales bacterium]